MELWYFIDGSGQRRGPHPWDEVLRFIALRVIQPHTMMQSAAGDEFFRAARLKAEFPAEARQAGPSASPARQRSDSSRMLSSLIGRPASDIDLSMQLIRDNCAYGVLDIPKPRGGFRRIHPPHETLKRVQRGILERILYQVPVHLVAHGFCRNRDIVTNAHSHLGARSVFNLDLKDAFPSVRTSRVRVNLSSHASRLVMSQFGRQDGHDMATQLLDLLLALVMHRDSLPQGAPTSPAILNIVCLNLDRQLFTLCSKHGLTVTRYADDITVSSASGDIPGELRQWIRSTISNAGWKVNQQKVSYASRTHGNALEVTGLLIHEDGRLSIAPDRRRAYRDYLVKRATQSRVSDEERLTIEGIMSFVRRIYRREVPSSLRGPIEKLDKILAATPRRSGQGRRLDLYQQEPME